ncbi:hypothetical protein DXG03_002591 [Asterophora parasitica]|uniref:FAD/NAD(P)-binding domain-containing protein n=1 Tax=Asterophora parasitica TaxID=117018 RepID=A0A9P7FWG7_9AGAR|nr:hypothetical protein DXG03_002591 [Asterophora parasitica]
MYLVRTVQLLGAVALVASQAQVPLSGSGGSQHKGPWPLDDASDHYTFKWPIRKVAIIGAGPSGVLSYREFTKLGFEVHLFERDHGPGGNWVYSEDVADPAPIPNADISIGDFVPSLPPKGAQLPYEEVYHGRRVVGDLVRRHRGPKPIWNTLHSNAPAPLQQVQSEYDMIFKYISIDPTPF